MNVWQWAIPSSCPNSSNRSRQQYSIRDLGFPANNPRLQLTRTLQYLELTCRTFCESLLKQSSPPYRLVTTPILSSIQLAAFDQADTRPDSSKFRQYVGCINWATEHARPDAAQVAHQLEQPHQRPHGHSHPNNPIPTLHQAPRSQIPH